MSPSSASQPSVPLGAPRARFITLVIAWRNLMQNRKRTLTALGGITFAVLLVFMQLGFLLAARRGATLLYEDLNFDIAVVSERYQSIAALGRFPRGRLAQIASMPGVEAVAPFYVKTANWKNEATGELTSAMILGLPDDPAFLRNPVLRAAFPRLTASDELLVDGLSHADLGELGVGTQPEVAGLKFKIVGQFYQGMSMFSEGAAAMRLGAYDRIFRGGSAEVNIGLVRVAPGVDANKVLAVLKASLPSDVIVFSRDVLILQDQDYFVSVKPVGMVFKVGVFVALAVGVVILFQVLSTEVSNRLREYATLKALGFTNRFIYRIGVVQALIFGCLSFVPATGLSFAVYWLVRWLSRLPMKLTPALVSLVLGLTLAMCVISCVLALGKVRRADPAELF
jgi:putative ABC transport system permease protein